MKLHTSTRLIIAAAALGHDAKPAPHALVKFTALPTSAHHLVNRVGMNWCSSGLVCCDDKTFGRVCVKPDIESCWAYVDLHATPR
ncbi:unnamed protein product [Zymoseptoria tritici ST99CH_3D7]|uniref:Uncharacterized protein n=1 Tax=Zymoseptoria tritici (strain ST99CH_3D7) TaxID=1276538 RepID=A0A1X7SA93_ZYMT9|nr:unnamed protein product [Zymoseptoria tritici ST99CH_3D7]